MEEKITAVYLMVRNSELTPEDRGSYERPLEAQKQKCLEYIREKGLERESRIVFYTSRSDLLKDIERDLVARLVVRSKDRLGAHPSDLEGIFFELEKRTVEFFSVEEDDKPAP